LYHHRHSRISRPQLIYFVLDQSQEAGEENIEYLFTSRNLLFSMLFMGLTVFSSLYFNVNVARAALLFISLTLAEWL